MSNPNGKDITRRSPLERALGRVVPRDPFFALDTLFGVSFMVGGSK